MDHVMSIIRSRKDSTTPFGFSFHSIMFHQSQQILPKETVKSAVKKATIKTISGDEIFQFSGIWKVTAGLAADKNFFTGLLHLFQQEPFRTHLGRSTRRHHAASAGPNY